ncbi:hypothetical protein DFS34DRAFT_592656 [Phlyctochytrium arcticum]|nr:hypothetical protein DFS34DRAFT_592656 [Phlyctochytrium arcticum]
MHFTKFAVAAAVAALSGLASTAPLLPITTICGSTDIRTPELNDFLIGFKSDVSLSAQDLQTVRNAIATAPVAGRVCEEFISDEETHMNVVMHKDLLNNLRLLPAVSYVVPINSMSRRDETVPAPLLPTTNMCDTKDVRAPGLVDFMIGFKVGISLDSGDVKTVRNAVTTAPSGGRVCDEYASESQTIMNVVMHKNMVNKLRKNPSVSYVVPIASGIARREEDVPTTLLPVTNMCNSRDVRAAGLGDFEIGFKSDISLTLEDIEFVRVAILNAPVEGRICEKIATDGQTTMIVVMHNDIVDDLLQLPSVSYVAPIAF